MPDTPRRPTDSDKRLYTPGPLTTSDSVKRAMLHDMGSRDAQFIQRVADIRRRLLQIAGVGEPDYTAIPMQGSGTFSIEAVLASVTPPQGHWLVGSNGAYGRRIAQIAERLGLRVSVVEGPENQPLRVDSLDKALAGDRSIGHVALVHCETSSGLLNPVEEIGRRVRGHGRLLLVDAMSSFGAVPLQPARAGIQFLVSSANKCIEGVPGFGFVLAQRAILEATRGWARSVALDLLAQCEGLDRDGQFRFTPPTHALLGFHQALRELEDEGGVEARAGRYARNRQTLVDGMERLGFEPYLDPACRSDIIQSFRYPDGAWFDFQAFYDLLSAEGHLIYPGKLSQASCFRIGTIGRLFPSDFEALLVAVDNAIRVLRRRAS